MFRVGDIVEVVNSVEQVLIGARGEVIGIIGNNYCVQFDDPKLEKYYNRCDSRGFAEFRLRLVERGCYVDRKEFHSIIMCQE